MPPSRHRPPPWTPPPTLDEPIQTPRLRMRVLQPTDAADHHRLVDAERHRLLPWMPWAATSHLTEDDSRTTLTRWATDRSVDPTVGRMWGLFDRAGGALVGAISLAGFDRDVAATEIGVLVAASHARRGLATEAVRHLVSTALLPVADGGWGLNRVHMRTAGSNVAAQAVAKALGIRREMRRRQHELVEGVGVDDTYGWGVLADEWDCAAMAMRRADPEPDVGLGPHPTPWPDDPRLDPLLLRDGDRRNVADRYRYWRHEAIVADLAASANPFHVAVENWRHDMNIGTVVRNANAFGAAAVHVVGRRSWNRRGAMVTDRYLTIHHHPDIAALSTWAAQEDLRLVGVDNLPGSVSIFEHAPPERCVLVLGQEGPGLSPQAREAVEAILHIPQWGSTRSINAGVASGIAMATWMQVHRPGTER